MDKVLVANLFTRYFKPVRKWLRRTGVGTGNTDDLAMEVFLRLLRYDSASTLTNPAGYVFKIAANVASEWRTLSRVAKPHDSEWLEELHYTDESLDADELKLYVEQLFDVLPPRRRQILYMHVYDGLTYKDIAIKLGLTYRIVLRELTKSYTALRIKVAQDGVL